MTLSLAKLKRSSGLVGSLGCGVRYMYSCRLSIVRMGRLLIEEGQMAWFIFSLALLTGTARKMGLRADGPK
jgi:hypothetical protein